MAERITEYIDLAELQAIVPSYTRRRELEMWERNGPSGDDLAALPTPPPDAVLRYADHQDGVIDVYLPTGPATPRRLVFAVHGGAFRNDWDRGYLRHFARQLTLHGVVVALPEFRRVGGGGEWPTIGVDVEAALAFVRKGVEQVAPGWVDPTERLIVVGHSSGAHIGPWAALRAGSDVVSKIVAIAAPFDLPFLSRTRHLNGFVDDLLGGTPKQVPDAYEEADPYRLIKGDIPITIVQGTEDLQLTVEMSRRAAARLADTPGFSYVEVAGADHFDTINPASSACVEVVIPIVLA